MAKSKNLFFSKTFWLNAIGIGTLVIPGLGINPVTIGYILGGLNIANRLLTEGPAHVIADASAKP